MAIRQAVGPPREDPLVQPLSPSSLIERVRALPAAVPLLTRLQEDETPVYLVGGAVRDLLLGSCPNELDLVVEGDAAALANRLGRAKVHDRFGTSTVALDGLTYDIARARTETYSRPGALPDVKPATLDQDLLRRDFTVNALAIALTGETPGTLRSAPRALEDLEARQLRVLHERSFVDDPTRLVRLARYASRLGFAIEPGTLELARAAVRAEAVSTVSGSRLGAELRLLAREPDPVGALLALRELGVDAALQEGFGLRDPELARRALALLPEDGRRDLVVLGVASRGIEPAALRRLLDGLAFEAGERQVIVAIASAAASIADRLARAERPSQILEAVGSAGPEVVAVAGALDAPEQARQWLEGLRSIRLEITGHDLLRAGVQPGVAVGEGLRAALAAKLDGLATGREQELASALRTARGSG